MWRWCWVVVLCVGCRREHAHEESAGVAVALAPAPAVRAQPPFDVSAPSDPVVALARGGRHACVVRASGAVDCWGQPITKRCKGCMTEPAPDPTVRRVPGVTDAIAITANARCVLRKTGEVACLDEAELKLVAVPGIAGATAIAGSPPCALVGKGDIVCASMKTPGTATTIPNVHDAIALTAGGIVRCALRKTGQVWCGMHGDAMERIAGLDHVTELAGDGELINLRLCATIQKRGLHCYDLIKLDTWTLTEHDRDDEPLLAGPPIEGASQLVVWSEDHDQRFFAELVVGGTVKRITFPTVTDVPQLADAKLLARGCALRAQGSVVCWGDNDGGVLAQPTTLGQVRLPAAPVVGLADVTGLALGDMRAKAMTRDHTIWEWGRSTVDDKPHSMPQHYQPIGAPTDFVEIAGLDGELCARRGSGETWCEVHEHDRSVMGPADPEQLAGLPWGDPFETRYVADYLRCRRTKDRHVTCNGKPIALDRVDQIATGYDYGCARHGGRVSCWTIDIVKGVFGAPFSIPAITDATELAGGPDQACAIHAHGKVTCWHVAETGLAEPPQQMLDGGAVAIAIGHGTWERLAFSRDNDAAPAAERLACAILANRTVTCWGANLYGELGDGSFVETTQPVGIRL